MKKREFLKLTSKGLLALPLLTTASSIWANTSVTKNWMWLHPKPETTDEEWKQLFFNAKKAGVDAVFAQVYNGTFAYFDHPTIEQKDHILERIIPIAHREGVEVHGWMWTMICNNASILKNHPEWYAVNRNLESAASKPAYVNYYKFLCPRHPEVREFVQGNVRALANVEGIDGVHLDYVRQPDVILAEALQPKYNIVQDKEYPEYDYCYSDLCRESFKEKTGIDPAKDLKDPAAHQEWRQYRYDGVSDLVNNHLAPEARKKSKFISAAVFPNWESVRQEWSEWNLDAFFPMLYHNFYNETYDWIYTQTKAMVARQKFNRKIYSGLFVPNIPASDLAKVIKGCKEAGGSGVSFFDYRSLTKDHWKAL